MKQESLLDTTAKLEDIHHLPTNRLPEKRKYQKNIFMDKNRNTNNLKSFLDPSLNTIVDPNVLKLKSLETIDSYPATSIHGYKDGSEQHLPDSEFT